MSSVTVFSQHSVGPLSVELINGAGRVVAGPKLLSASETTVEFPAVPAGSYTIVATRPEGTAFIQPVEVSTRITFVNLGVAGDSPHEWLRSAADRGLVPAEHEKTRTDKIVPAPPSLAGTAGRNLYALTLATGDLRLTTEYRICGWGCGSDRIWKPEPVKPPKHHSGAYLQLEFADGGSHDRAVGLLDRQGYGPIVMVPPFVNGIDITFLSEGLQATHTGARVENPSAIRTPVALAVPKDPAMADLLTGLHAPAMPQADTLWTQVASKLDGVPADDALHALAEKYEKRTEAILGALFLARFAPNRIPSHWIGNLNALTPQVADSAMLGAWLAMTRPSDPPQTRDGVAAFLSDAAGRPCTHFARTRSQLGQALRLYATPLPSIGAYLDFAADAGGLEAFWGSSPCSPGGSTPSLTFPLGSETVVWLQDGQFSL